MPSIADEPFVFLSYARSDVALARRISAALTSAGVQTWLDVERLTPGTNFAEAIREALRQTSALVLILSSDSLRSNWVSQELTTTASAGRAVFPVIAPYAGDIALTAETAHYQWTDLREDHDDEELSALVRAVQRQLGVDGRSEPAMAPVSTPPVRSKGYAFISYAAEDFTFVDELVGFLHDRGYGYWEYSTSERDYQGQIHLELEDVIRNAGATISVLTPEWKRSDWTVREYFYSKEVGTPVFLLRLRDMGPTLVIAGTPYIDFSQDREHGFTRLEQLLDRRRLLG